MTTNREWDQAVAEQADLAVKAAGEDGTSRKEIEPVITKALQRLLDSGKLSRPGLEDAVSRSLDRLDQSRRVDAADFHHVLDALNDDTILGTDDPWLDLMAVIGTGGGLRKANRWLTPDDLDAMVTYRRTKMREVAESFHVFADAVDALKSAMRDRHAKSVGDLYRPATPDEDES